MFANRIIIFCLEILNSVEKYSTRCSHSAASIGNNIFPEGIIKLKYFTVYIALPLPTAH
jgi:hypothetical protein